MAADFMRTESVMRQLSDVMAKRLFSPVAIAFSGGLDSRFLAFATAKIARQHGLETPILVHCKGVHIPTAETISAVAWAQKQNLRIMCIPVSVLTVREIANNCKTRCYFCKKLLIAEIRKALTKNGCSPCMTVCDGTNGSDMHTYRPGLKALKETGIVSPLAELNLSKDDIRDVARDIGLDNPNQLPRPCLLTRFPYGYAVTNDDCAYVERLEARVAKIVPEDVEFRVRILGKKRFLVQLSSKMYKDWQDIDASLRSGLADPNLTIVHSEILSGYFEHVSTT